MLLCDVSMTRAFQRRTFVARHLATGLNMRIGLHHGQFVAGVIGSNQLRFDIWGEDRLMSVKQRIHS